MIITHLPKLTASPTISDILKFPDYLINNQDFKNIFDVNDNNNNNNKIRIINSNKHNSINMTLNHQKDKRLSSQH